ncbi:C-type lectin domain family 4 member M-like isoform X2 [Colossoma macropomum]|uniref:C-type lectin domain family 4 member M-like isoform X2 n=1 Tax=Colossoma macropomum TaxID=42526 RepID=UPI0018654CA6|nr:C-type lectin domain family 4 member M-like isoform X2 [Colossoma macropomum]
MFSTAPTRTRNNGNQPNGSPDFVGDTMDSPSKTEHRGMAAYRVYRLGLLCLGVMCILQASLNITLRLFLQKTCPDGWTRRGTSMYYIGTGEKNWHQSRQDCRERGSDLVIINSREEQRFIQELNLQVWIGLSESQSTWTWVDGSSPSSEYWINGEPNEYRTGEDCAESKPNYEPPNTWNDERCSTVLNWVCEREAC